MLNALASIAHLKSGKSTNHELQSNYPLWLLVLTISCLMFLPTLGSVGLFDPSDAYYSEGAREMLERGNLLVPVLNYTNYYDKPILNYWFIIASYKIFGITPFAARLPAAISTTATALLLFFKSRRFIGKDAALLASLIFISSPIVLIVGRFSLTDMPLCFFESAALLFLFEGLLTKNVFQLVVGYLSVALAVLIKGPVAVVTVGSVLFVLASVIAVRGRTFSVVLKRIQQSRLLLGFLIICIVSVPWYIAVHIATAGEFSQSFFVGQNLGRALGKTNHTAPWFYYIPIFLGSFFPWSVLLLTKISFAKKDVLISFGRRYLYLLFCGCWVAFVAVLFSVTPTKLPTYILPIYPPCAILLAAFLSDAVKQKTSKTLRLGAILLSSSSCLLAILLPLFVTGAVSMRTLFSLHDFQPAKLAHTFTGSYFSLELWAIAVAVASLAYLWLVLVDMPKQALSLLFGALLIISICFIPLVIRHFYDVRQAGFAKLVRLVEQVDKPVATIEAFQPSASFVLRKHVSVVKTPADLKNFLKSSMDEHLLLVPDSRMSVLLWLKHPPKVINSSGGWTLVLVQGE